MCGQPRGPCPGPQVGPSRPGAIVGEAACRGLTLDAVAVGSIERRAGNGPRPKVARVGWACWRFQSRRTMID